MNFSKSDYKYFEMARKEAKQSDFNSFHLGCIIVYKGYVLASGHNSNKTNPLQKKYNRKYRDFRKGSKPIVDSLHAEIASLISIPYPIEKNVNWRDVKVYIYRISPGKRLKMGLARPCPSCMAALRDKGVRHLYYTTDDGFAKEELF